MERKVDEEAWNLQFSDPSGLRDQVEALRHQSIANQNHADEGRALVLLASLENRLGIPEHSSDLYKKAEGILSALAEPLWSLRAQIGLNLAELKGKDDTTKCQFLEQTINANKQLLPFVDQAMVYHALAIYYSNVDKTGAALRHYYQALLCAQNSKNHALIMEIQNDLGTCQMVLGNYLEARLQFESALIRNEAHAVPLLAPLIACNLALVLIELSENEAAFEVVHAHRNGLTKVALRNRGFIPAIHAFAAVKTGQLELARTELKAAEQIVGALDGKSLDANNLLQVQIAWTRAVLEQNEGKFKSALANVQKGLELLKHTPEPIYELNLLDLAATLYAGLGDFQQAYRIQLMYLKMQKDRQGIGAKSISLSLQIQHEVAEAEFERDQALMAVDEVKLSNQRLTELNATLERRLGEIENLKKQLREQSIKDTLTGLYNRPYLEEAMFGIMRLAHRQKKPLSIALLDMDNFREFNETYGHSFADAILIALAELLTKNSRDSDLVARYGGEEFCVVFADMEPELAQKRLDELLEEFKAVELSSAGMHMTGASFSAGIARFPTDAGTFDQLITLADCAMTQAKEQGGAKVIAYASLVGVAAEA